MNIVKIKDVILTPESGLTKEQIRVFNESFKAKYVHCLDWMWCVPVEDMNVSDAVLASTALMVDDPEAVLADYPHFDYNTLMPYVDKDLTALANDLNKYIVFNQFSPSGKLTWAQIKVFRTWLASTILSFNIVLDHDTNHMLSYYAGGMHDDVVDALTTFGSTNISLTSLTTPGCGCHGSTGATQSVVASTVGSSACGCAGNQNLASLYNQGLMNCNPLWIYRKNIYVKMVNVFSNIDFWLQFENDFIAEFKLYIDNIIKMNLSLVTSAWQSDFVDCGCVNDQLAAQQRNIARLERLSNALHYIHEELSGHEGMSGHKNYIQTALNEWATYLYEMMEWQ